MLQIANNKRIGGGTEELAKYLSTIITTGKNLEQQVDIFEKALQSACRRTFQTSNKGKKISKKKSVPWWRESLTSMQKQVNACRRLYQITKNDEDLSEHRKQIYAEAKRKYQAGIKKEKLNSWKEYCNVAASTNPWSQVYKLAAGKTRIKSIMTTLTKPDGSEAKVIQEIMEVMLDYLFTEDKVEENLHHEI